MMSTPEPGPPAASRSTGMIVAGVVSIVVGVLIAAVLWFVAADQVARSAASLARAPVGCDTTLEFSETGTFVLFVETRGRIDDLDGRCEAPARYDHRATTPPVVAVTMFDASGRDVPLSTPGEASYDAGGFVGTAHRSVTIAEPGRFVVRVESAETNVVVAVGRDPSEAGDMLRLGGLAGGVTLVVIGLVLVVVGSIGRSGATPTTSPPGPPWAGTVAGPPPVAPPPPPPPPGTTTGPPLAGPSGGDLPPPSGPPVG